MKRISNRDIAPKVLVAPLDWGLGHAIRCIPIIQELIAEDFIVFLAVTSKIEILLRRELPEAHFLQIPAYNIIYSRTGRGLPFKIILQLPKVFMAIQREQQWIKSLMKSQKMDIIISDNRPGLNHRDAYGIYITHQLNFATRYNLLNRLASLLHRHYIKKFNECWIPDSPDGLSGKLSNISPLPDSYHFIGPLSRFQNKKCDIKYDLAIILSGPEPQRTILENLLINQISQIHKRLIFVRGIPDEKSTITNQENLTFFNYLSKTELNDVIVQSSIVISRSGYTSIMDFARLNTKAILIPTPGQPEQEYLAEYLSKKGYFPSFSQQGFFLKEALESAEKFRFRQMNFDFNSYKNFIHQLRQKKESPLQTRR